MTPLARQIGATLIVLLHLMVDVAAIPVANRFKLGDGSGFGASVLLGLLLGQISLIAAYLAWGLDHWASRWTKSCLLAMLAWYAIAVGAVSTGDSFEVSSIERLLAMVVGVLFLFTCIPYWAIRGVCRSRFEVVDDDHAPTNLFRTQFRVRDLLSWTLGAAVLIAIACSPVGRETWGKGWSLSGEDLAGISMWMSAIAMLCVLLAIPTVWAGLGRHKLGPRALGVGLYAALVVAFEWALIYAVGGGGQFRLHVAVVGLNLGVLCEVFCCSLLLRACGYRLHLYTPPSRNECS